MSTESSLLVRAMITQHIRVEGRVQGVFFRDYTCRQALTLNLTGWVRNVPDGSVEVLLSGKEEAISAMVKWLHQGSPHSRVDRLHIREAEAENALTTFDVRY